MEANTYDHNHNAHPAAFTLGEWRVDVSANRLLRGDDVVKLEARLMQVLCELAQRQQQVVLRETLEQAVWGKTVVGYDALTRCIAGLRKALEDDPRQPRYIETISKRGYKLIADVAYREQCIQPPENHGRRWFTGGVLTVLLLTGLYIGFTERSKPLPTLASLPAVSHPARPRLVITPFANLEDALDDDALSRGFTADISTALAGLTALEVIHETDEGVLTTKTATQYRLQGALRKNQQHLRVNLRLSDAQSGAHLWSKTYDKTWRDVFSLQDDIVRQIAQALALQLSSAEAHRIARRYTISPAAYESFLRGQAHYLDHTPLGNRQARQFFNLAIAQDPSFARAYSALALTQVAEQRQGWHPSTPQAMDTALANAHQGVTLDPASPQTQWALAYVHLFRREYDAAGDAARQAATLAPGFADNYLILAVCHLNQGNSAQAVRFARRAMQLNPEYPAAYASILGQAYFFAGQHQAALQALRAALARNSQLLTAHVFHVATLGKLGQPADAAWAAEELRQSAPTFSTQQLAGLVSIQNPLILADVRRQLQAVGF